MTALRINFHVADFLALAQLPWRLLPAVWL
jgi:hypothetical protein